MYRYDEFDARFVNERVAQFRRQVQRRLGGELTEDQFRPLRLGIAVDQRTGPDRRIPVLTRVQKHHHAIGQTVGDNHLRHHYSARLRWPDRLLRSAYSTRSIGRHS